MKCLVTGGAGFIGSHTVDILLENNHEVVVVDNFLTSNEKNLNPKAKLYKIDVTSEKLEQVFKKEKPEIVYHLAAQPAVRISTKDPMFDADINIRGTINVLEMCVKYDIKRIIYSSSGGTVYGDCKPLPATENSETIPMSQYGLSKLTAEKYIQLYNRLHGLDYIILRYGNVYGPRQDPMCEAGVIAIFIDRMIKEQDPEIFGDGKQTRDYIYVTDVAKANLLAMSATSKQKIFNISSCTETSVNDIFIQLKDAMFEFINHEYIARYRDPIEGELKRIYLDNYSAKRNLKWKPEVGMSEGMKKTVAYFISQIREK
jgi:UDP-glucose 4-epimerase